MQILLIHQHYYPELGGTAKTTTEIAEYLAENGHQVTVISEYPNRGFQSTSEEQTLKTVEIRNKVKLYRLKNHFPYSGSKASRIMGYLHFTISSFFKAIFLRRSFDVCITVQALPAAIPGVLIQMVKGIKHHFYCTDMMPDLGVVTGLKENSIIVRLARIVERFVYAKSYAIYAVTPRMVEQIKERTKNPNVFVLPDWSDVAFFQAKRYEFIDELKERYGVAGKRLIVYVGNIGLLQNLSLLVDIGERLATEPEFSDCLILIGGAGVQKEQIEAQCRQRGVDNVRFIGVVKHEQVPSLLELSSVLIMNFVAHPHLALYRSSKIMDYIMAEKPVVVGAQGELADIVLKNHLGVVAKPSDSNDFFRQLRTVLKQTWNIDNTHLIKSFEKNSILREFSDRATTRDCPYNK